MKYVMQRLALIVSVACGVVSCINDDYPSDRGPAGTRGSGYMIYQIKTSVDGTRAENGEFNDGERNEHALAPGEHHFAMFYDTNSDSTPVLVASLSNLSETMNPDNAITKSLLAIYPLSMDRYPDVGAFLMNKECLVLLNTDYTEEQLAAIRKSDLKSQIVDRATIHVGSTDYFTMSNSAYVSGTSNTLASSVDASKYWSSESAARDAAQNGEATVIAYVERVAAKVRPVKFEYGNAEQLYLRHGGDFVNINLFTGLTGAPRYDTRYQATNWNAKLTGYGINGLEKEAYLYKNIQNKTYFQSWNDNPNHRSYWAQDTHYEIDGNTVKGYPHQYRSILDSEKPDTLRDYHSGFDHTYERFNTDNNRYYLKYYSYNDIQKPLSELQNPQALYSFENTYDDTGKRLYTYGYFSAGTHFLVACKLIIDGVEEGRDLYKDQNEIFYKSADEILQAKLTLLNEKALPGGNSGINILHVNWGHFNDGINYSDYIKPISWPVGSRLYIRTNGNNDEEAKADDFELIPAELTGGDGKVLIAPRSKTARYIIKNDTDEEEISYNELISLFHKLMGAIDHFAGGAMYYPAPISHNAPSNADSSSTELGSVGVVRNHEYQISINSISRPGRPVDRNAQPIIPMLDTQRDYIDVSVNILDWHHIEQDNVPFYPSQN